MTHGHFTSVSPLILVAITYKEETWVIEVEDRRRRRKPWNENLEFHMLQLVYR
jgi:hypothetical protein